MSQRTAAEVCWSIICFCHSRVYPSNSICIWLCQGHEESRRDNGWQPCPSWGLFLLHLHPTQENPCPGRALISAPFCQVSKTTQGAKQGWDLHSSPSEPPVHIYDLCLALSRTSLQENLSNSLIFGAQTVCFLRIVACVSNYALGWQCLLPGKEVWDARDGSLRLHYSILGWCLRLSCRGRHM